MGWRAAVDALGPKASKVPRPPLWSLVHSPHAQCYATAWRAARASPSPRLDPAECAGSARVLCWAPRAGRGRVRRTADALSRADGGRRAGAAGRARARGDADRARLYV